MYIVSEEMNSYGGKFPLEELYKIAHKNDLNKVALSVMTKAGVRIFSTHEQSLHNMGLLYKPTVTKAENKISSVSKYSIRYYGPEMVLSLYTQTDEKHFLVRGFLRKNFLSGKRFIAEQLDKEIFMSVKNSIINSGTYNLLDEKNKTLQLELIGAVIENITMQPILLHQKEKFLFYKSNSYN